jgi:5-amino-6-(5-phosphoribosylamino)uracil reductase
MNGAETLRRSGASSRVRDDDLVEWRREHGHAELPLGLIITRRAEFELRGPYFKPDSGLHAIIMATDASPERRRVIEAAGAEVLDLAEGPDGLRGALRFLRQERGVRYLLCEGGPTTLGSLVQAGAADEFFLTRSPLLVGGPDHTTIFHSSHDPDRENVHRLELLTVVANRETNELYLRYRFAGLGALA